MFSVTVFLSYIFKFDGEAVRTTSSNDRPNLTSSVSYITSLALGAKLAIAAVVAQAVE